VCHTAERFIKKEGGCFLLYMYVCRCVCLGELDNQLSSLLGHLGQNDCFFFFLRRG
jgi:hypothetical protein